MTQRRRLTHYGYEPRRIRLVLTVEQWAEVKQAADRYEQTIAATVEQAVRHELVAERKLDDPRTPLLVEEPYGLTQGDLGREGGYR